MIFSRIFSLYFALIALVIVLFPKLIAVCLVLFVPLLIVGLRKKKLKFRISTLNILFLVFYGLYAFYAIYSRHWDWAGTYLENKLSFVLFPFIFSFIPTEKLEWKWPALGFTIATLVLGVLGLFHSAACASVTEGLACWVTVSFSYLHHPSYASVYFTVALFLIWYLRYKTNVKIPLWLALMYSIAMLLFIFLCLSLAGLLFIMISFSVFGLIAIHKRWGKKASLASIVLIPLFLFGIVTIEPHIKGEVESALNQAKTYLNDPSEFIKNKQYPMSGSEVRLVMWTAATQTASDYPLGVGTGNVDEVLGAKLRSLGQYEMAKQNYNPHNQYLQTWIEIGVFGFLVLLSLLFYPIWIAIKKRNYLLLLVVGSLAFNMLFESMLQRQSGIVFYAFAICFLTLFSQLESVRKPIEKSNN